MGNMSADRGPLQTRISIAMSVLPAAALSLRLWSRAISKESNFWWDDFFAVLELVGRNAFLKVLAYLTKLTMKTDILRNADCCDINYSALWGRAARCSKATKEIHAVTGDFNVGETLFDFAVGTVKFSALFFHLRIFSPDKYSKFALYATQGLVACTKSLIRIESYSNTSETQVCYMWHTTIVGFTGIL